MRKIINYEGWIEPISNITCNIEILLEEYQNFGISLMKPYNKSPTMMDLGFIINDNIPVDILNKMPATKQIANEVCDIFDFTSMVYRLMRPISLYKWHQDTSLISYHIPLITNPACMFIYEDKHFHMPADGSLYLTNNTRFHTFINAGDTDRIHIVFNKKNNGNHYKILNHLSLYKER